MEFRNLEYAREVLGLSKKFSLTELKKRYKDLAFLYHPDTCKEPNKAVCKKKFDTLFKAYELLEKYLTNYKVPITEKDFLKTNFLSDEEFFKRQFYNSWE